MPILLPEQTDVVAFGDFLRQAREQRGLTLQQIARETRIPWRHLDALEHGNLAAVPSGMYRRAEIRAYADAVGLDRALALAQLEHALAVALPDRPREGESAPSPWHAATGARVVGALGVAAFVTLAGIAWWRAAPARAREGDARPPQVAVTPPQPGVGEGPGPITASPQQVGAAGSSDVTAPPAAAAPGPGAPRADVVAPVEPSPLPAAPAPAGATEVALVVTTEPSGARVMVDGIARGVSPVTIRHLAPGVRRVRVVKDGFLGEERSVRVAAAREPASVTIAMQPAGTP